MHRNYTSLDNKAMLIKHNSSTRPNFETFSGLNYNGIQTLYCLEVRCSIVLGRT